MTTLFEPITLGALRLPHRVVMAPMTRSRSEQPGNVPTSLNAEYYEQRAGAALIISEATQISPQGQGYSFTPGLHNEDQVAGWRKVTDAVHAAGGRMFAQLWHVGRMSHSSFQGDVTPVAPSAIDSGARVWISDGVSGRMVPTTPPRALRATEIAGIVQDYARAASNAIAAGFDGVEIHGANGYLIDQFLRTASNQRIDAYGGSVQRRIRFAVEVAEAVANTIGSERVGMRLSPHVSARGMACPEIEGTTFALARVLDRLDLAYVHLAEADWEDAPDVPEQFRAALRETFGGRIIVAGGYTPERATRILEAGHADLVAFGRPFIGNPDYPNRVRTGAPLAGFDATLLYGGDAAGYTDFPALIDAGASATEGAVV